jgi:Recombination endonuclease VII
MKKCSRCQELKPLEQFYSDPRYRDGKSSRCKICACQVSQQSQKSNPDRYRANTKRWRERHGEELSEFTRRQKFGLPFGSYAEILTLQNGVCAICHKAPEPGSELYVDHCHATNFVRGLLCHDCNTGLGFLKDSTLLLDAAKTYLLGPPVKIPMVKAVRSRRPNQFPRTKS